MSRHFGFNLLGLKYLIIKESNDDNKEAMCVYIQVYMYSCVHTHAQVSLKVNVSLLIFHSLRNFPVYIIKILHSVFDQAISAIRLDFIKNQDLND